MSEFNDPTENGLMGSPDENTEASSNIFLNMAQEDSTGIPSLKQAPASAISSSTSDSKVSGQLLIAVSVLAIGGGAIYGMRYLGMQAGLDENIVSIEYASETNTTDISNRFQTVMRNLDESTLAVQIEDKDAFSVSPFTRIEADAEPDILIDPGMSEEERLARQAEYELKRERELRHTMVMSEAMRFTLQGVVGGSRPAARVSGMPVRAGMTLGEFFTVSEITGRSVIIEADGMRFELVMGQETVQLD